GPASYSSPILRKMMLAGLDVARLNFSHGTLKQHQACINLIRRLNKKYRRHIRILGDLEGYRIRIGRLKAPIELKKNQKIFLVQKDMPAEGNFIPFDYSGDLKDIKKGSRVYIDDGNIALMVEGHLNNFIKTKVEIAGVLKEHKGVNIPDVKLKLSGITLKDRVDIKFCLKNKLDFIAQSFVRDKFDILNLRKIMPKNPSCPKIIAKIENRQGINNIDSIIKVADGIMVARGDMGVSLPIYEVPVIQKQIIRKCNKSGKFVITATQMLESMVENLRPSRAEVSDVANAIIDGSDFVMLSAESAVGKHPAESVRMMNEIIKFTEKHKDI
ncbi:pyruvate kinase, partial [bacterium]